MFEQGQWMPLIAYAEAWGAPMGEGESLSLRFNEVLVIDLSATTSE